MSQRRIRTCAAPPGEARTGAVVDCALYQGGKRCADELDLQAAAAIACAEAEAGSFLWIGLHEPDAEQLAEVASVFDLHPLAVQDALHAHQRPKLERYGDTLFLVLKTVVYVEHDELTATSEVVDTGQVALFCGPGFLVGVRHGSSRSLEPIRRRLEADPHLLAHGPAAALHAIADHTVDDYLTVADAFETDADLLESETFDPAAKPDIQRIYQLKRELLEFKRAVAPLARPLDRLASAQLPGVDGEVAAYFRDVRDHLEQVVERLGSFSELTDTILFATLAQIGIQQNDDVRRISAVAAIFAVPTLIAGIYGMNFDHMPELRSPLGYPAVLAAIAGACGGLYWVFRRNGWLGSSRRNSV